MIPEENLDGLVRDSAHRALELHRGLGQKSLRQVHDVLHTLPQRGHDDDEFVQAVIEILAESARSNLAVHGDVGRRDDPHIDRKRAFGPEDLHLALLERPEKLCLRWKGKVDDLVEEQRPTLSQLEVPLPSPVRPGERALLVAEQFRLDQRFGNRAAVQSHEGLLAAGTELVDRASHQLFPCAGLALDQDGEVGVGDLLDLLDHLLDLLAPAHEPAERVTLPEPPELFELRAQRLMLEGAPDHDENLCRLNGFGQEVVRAEPHGLDR